MCPYILPGRLGMYLLDLQDQQRKPGNDQLSIQCVKAGRSPRASQFQIGHTETVPGVSRLFLTLLSVLDSVLALTQG